MHLLLDPTRRPVIGHRGDRAHAPENTVESLLQAVHKGVDAVEFDLRLTRDGVPVLMHDPTLDRTTDARGNISAYTVADLRDVQVRGPQGQRASVPTLEAVLEALPKHLPLIIELKTEEVARPALRLLERAGILDRVLVGSFVDAALVPFAQAGVPHSPGSSALSSLFLPALLGRVEPRRPFQALCIPEYHDGWLPLPVRGYLKLMRAAGGPTHIWTVNNPRQAQRLWAAGVNGIISDDPGAILAARGQPVQASFPSP